MNEKRITSLIIVLLRGNDKYARNLFPTIHADNKLLVKDNIGTMCC
jgi:hypothetical protein